MGLSDALRNGDYKFLLNGCNNVSVNTGNSNNNIDIQSGGNVTINTGNGNQDITITGANNASINTGLFGNDNIDVDATSALINTNGGNDVVDFSGSQFQISALGGNNVISVDGNPSNNALNSIQVGDGNNTINTNEVRNINIATGNGNQNITVEEAHNTVINTGAFGNDYVNVESTRANITTNAGDDTIIFNGSQFNISAIGGNNKITATGDLSNTAAHNSITVGDGDLNEITAIANNLGVTAGDTDLNLFTIGDNTSVKAGDGQHSMTFLGDNVEFDLGHGDNVFNTLDFLTQAGQYSEYADYVDENIGQRLTEDVLLSSKRITKSSSHTTYGTSTSQQIGDQIVTSTLVSVTKTYKDYLREKYADLQETVIEGSGNVSITTKSGNNTGNINASNFSFNSDQAENNINVVDGIVLDSKYVNHYTKDTYISGSSRSNRSNSYSKSYADAPSQPNSTPDNSSQVNDTPVDNPDDSQNNTPPVDNTQDDNNSQQRVVDVVQWGSNPEPNVVYANDCLSRIIANNYDIRLYSSEYNELLDEICKKNNIKNPDLIYTGQQIILP